MRGRQGVLISARRQQAEQMELSPDLVEDVLRRIIRESYRTQTAQATPTSCDLERPVVIVGGRGRLGTLFCRLFKQTGYTVKVIDKGDALSDITEHHAPASDVLLVFRQVRNTVSTASGAEIVRIFEQDVKHRD